MAPESKARTTHARYIELFDDHELYLYDVLFPVHQHVQTGRLLKYLFFLLIAGSALLALLSPNGGVGGDVRYQTSIKYEFDSVWSEFLPKQDVLPARQYTLSTDTAAEGWRDGMLDFLRNLNGTVERSPLLVDSEPLVAPKWREAHSSRVLAISVLLPSSLEVWLDCPTLEPFRTSASDCRPPMFLETTEYLKLSGMPDRWVDSSTKLADGRVRVVVFGAPNLHDYERAEPNLNLGENGEAEVSPFEAYFAYSEARKAVFNISRLGAEGVDTIYDGILKDMILPKLETEFFTVLPTGDSVIYSMTIDQTTGQGGRAEVSTTSQYLHQRFVKPFITNKAFIDLEENNVLDIWELVRLSLLGLFALFFSFTVVDYLFEVDKCNTWRRYLEVEDGKFPSSALAGQKTCWQTFKGCGVSVGRVFLFSFTVLRHGFLGHRNGGSLWPFLGMAYCAVGTVAICFAVLVALMDIVAADWLLGVPMLPEFTKTECVAGRGDGCMYGYALDHQMQWAPYLDSFKETHDRINIIVIMLCITVALAGIRVGQFARFHEGLGLFWKVTAKAYNTIFDIMVTMGVTLVIVGGAFYLCANFAFPDLFAIGTEQYPMFSDVYSSAVGTTLPLLQDRYFSWLFPNPDPTSLPSYGNILVNGIKSDHVRVSVSWESYNRTKTALGFTAYNEAVEIPGGPTAVNEDIIPKEMPDDSVILVPETYTDPLTGLFLPNQLQQSDGAVILRIAVVLLIFFVTVVMLSGLMIVVIWDAYHKALAEHTLRPIRERRMHFWKLVQRYINLQAVYYNWKFGGACGVCNPFKWLACCTSSGNKKNHAYFKSKSKQKKGKQNAYKAKTKPKPQPPRKNSKRGSKTDPQVSPEELAVANQEQNQVTNEASSAPLVNEQVATSTDDMKIDVIDEDLPFVDEDGDYEDDRLEMIFDGSSMKNILLASN